MIVEEEITCTEQIDIMAIHSKDNQSKSGSHLILIDSREYFYNPLIFKLNIISVFFRNHM